MINAVGSSFPIISPNISRLKSGTGKVTVPVRPFQAYYTHFKHLTGVPSTKIESSVPLSKLRVLDHLIELLVGQKGKASQYLKISENNIDQLISKLSDEIRINENFKKNNYSTIMPEKGIFLNLLV
ncbi:MAG: hypothetical protein JXR70_14810 [Spirochaetales bacterium]|nr:hypothetical protein [Spirochaetales bacterium]